MIYIQQLRKNDINPDKGKQVEFGKSFFKNFHWDDDTSHDITIHFKDITINTKLNVRGSQRGGDRSGADCKEYANDNGELPLKNFFINKMKFNETHVGVVNFILEPLDDNGNEFNMYFVGGSTTPLPTPTTPLKEPLQQIFYGAPGTGKSHGIKDKESQFSEVIRTTFHPDSDYSTFVGAYKPVMDDIRKCVVIDKEEKEVKPLDGGSEFERRIAYKFIKQAFLKAYISAWKGLKENKPVLLVIEEINRGNCAQIFGDIFQLLDRDESGYSSYSIDADDDIQRELSEVFKEANIDIEEIKNGTKLLLPPNLYIWATMNTSDQSLFPIDSAFKRRWDWKYVPIDTRKENWVIEADGKNYSWSSFLEVINVHIHKATSSEDKMLGFYFCKAENGRITSERFVSKVLFYLYNDIFKDYGLDSFEFLKTEGTDEPISFRSFYGTDGKVVESQVATLLENLGVEKTEYVEEDEEVDSKETISKKLNNFLQKRHIQEIDVSDLES